jgi:hypothetical protein
MQTFIPGLKLSELFYSEAAKPVLETFFPELSYSAALLGWGSEVLFGRAFSELESASELSPIFRDVLLSLTWKERESNLSRAYRVIARMHNALKITRPIVEDVTSYFGRPYLVFESPDLVRDIVHNFTDEEVKAIKHGLGSVNQFVDSTDQLSKIKLVELLKAVYK